MTNELILGLDFQDLIPFNPIGNRCTWNNSEIRDYIIFGTQRGRASLKGLIIRNKDIDKYAKEAKKYVDSIKDDEWNTHLLDKLQKWVVRI